MKSLLIAIVLFLAAAILVLMVWRQLDHRADRAEMDRLRDLKSDAPAVFSLSMVEGLPEPARRYFAFAIADGTPLFTVAQIEMEGQFSLGTRDAPNYMSMQATQILAAPHGFIWTMSGGAGHLRMSGSDTGLWTRFWMAGVVPVARFGGDADHARSAFGRYASEAVFWTPAALLPGPNVTWEQIGDDVARVTLRHGDLVQAVDITLAADGSPMQVSFQRWSDANAEGTYRLQPFGGSLSDFRVFQGFQLPTHVEAGNFFGTDAYFPFFIADVTDIRFPEPSRQQ